ncbi:PREDICTED: lisH domain-containing protein C1711.05-like [Acropora digitifera]|uniref:lisH domain-containing protein C1711.05-like n=1 Tax=Acropora digitifera TaxID=70779 RepID=UPI00077AF6A4|nr:PREDICTED: lisH domain-containing protein C1711.05-like [Acropora digitifera]
MATVPSEIYPHIYSFLLQNKFVKTAKSFKKEALVDFLADDVIDCDIVEWYNTYLSSEKTERQRKRKVQDVSNEPKAKRRKKQTSTSESSCEEDIQVEKHVHLKAKAETFNSNHKKTWKQTVCHSGSEESKTSSKKSHLKAKKKKALISGLNGKVAKHEVQKSSSELSSEEEEKGSKKKSSTQLTKNKSQKTELLVNLGAKTSSSKEKMKDSAKSKVKKNSEAVISEDSKGLKKNKKEPSKASAKSSSSEEEESSVSSTSEEDVDLTLDKVNSAKSKVSLTAREGNNKQAQSSDKSSSSSESDSEPTVMPKTSSKLTSAKLGQNEKSLERKQNLNPVKQASKNKVIQRSTDSSDESSSSEDSEDELSKNEASSTSNNLITKNQSSLSEEESSDDDDDDDDDDDGVKSKSNLKAMVKEGATSKAISNNRLNGTVKEAKNQQKSLHKPQAASTPASNSKVNVKNGGSKTSFRRVKEEDIAVDPRLKDNSFEAKAGSRGDWGEKANKDLKFVKGKSFRHEKTKKKRGSYRGGQISTGIHSIKFDSD